MSDSHTHLISDGDHRMEDFFTLRGQGHDLWLQCSAQSKRVTRFLKYNLRRDSDGMWEVLANFYFNNRTTR